MIKSTYKEYPIRCYTCGDQIAAKSIEYEDKMGDGYSTIEEVLNELNIYDICCRQSIMNPTFVAFNMENRMLIEGLKSVEFVDDDSNFESTSEMRFIPCLSEFTQTQGLTTNQLPIQSSKIIKLNIDTTETIPPIIPQLSSITEEREVKDVKVTLPTKKPVEFKIPELTGFPVINNDPLLPVVTSYVGAHKSVEVLNGRTYYAR